MCVVVGEMASGDITIKSRYICYQKEGEWSEESWREREEDVKEAGRAVHGELKREKEREVKGERSKRTD